jgi:hypothetical protein
MKTRLLDLLGMLLVGDGALTLADPKRHCLIWEVGPKPCREMVDEFVKHPTLSRWLGAAEMAIGLMMAEMQKPKGLWRKG